MTRLVRVAGANTVVFSVDYRLAPENPYPAAADDAWGSLQWVHKNGHAQLGVDLSKLALGGSSRYASPAPG